MVAEDEPYFSKEKEVFNEFIRQINEALKNGYTVFADATHLNKSSRAKVLKRITSSREETNVIWIKTDLKTSLEQNEKRNGTRAYVPKETIEKMYHSIEAPTENENIDNIYCVDKNGHITDIITYI